MLSKIHALKRNNIQTEYGNTMARHMMKEEPSLKGMMLNINYINVRLFDSIMNI